MSALLFKLFHSCAHRPSPPLPGHCLHASNLLLVGLLLIGLVTFLLLFFYAVLALATLPKTRP